VVASALPEVQRLIDVYGIGWCVAPGDPVELAQALSRGLNARHDPELAGRLARASAELRWSLEQTRLLELYAELAGELG
jgi:glycosyltransferase involved in cell wall biosynthesis